MKFNKFSICYTNIRKYESLLFDGFAYLNLFSPMTDAPELRLDTANGCRPNGWREQEKFGERQRLEKKA